MDTDPLNPNIPNNTLNNMPNTPPTDMPTAAPAPTPIETPAAMPEAPVEAPASAPTTIPITTPADTAADTMNNTMAETPTTAPIEAPIEAPAEMPANPAPSAKKPVALIAIITILSIAIIAVVIVLIINLMPSNKSTGGNNSESSQANSSNNNGENDNNNQSNSDNTNTVNPGDTNLSNNWQEYAFSVNGQTITLPTSYQYISAVSGFTMKDADAGSTIASGYYSLVNLFQNDTLALYTEVDNDTGDYVELANGKITRISQTSFMTKKGVNTVTFPGNIYAGMPMDEETLTSILGTPDESKDYSVNKEYRYYADPSWTTTNFYKITIKDGVVDEITLDNRQ